MQLVLKVISSHNEPRLGLESLKSVTDKARYALAKMIGYRLEKEEQGELEQSQEPVMGLAKTRSKPERAAGNAESCVCLG